MIEIGVLCHQRLKFSVSKTLPPTSCIVDIATYKNNVSTGRENPSASTTSPSSTLL